MKNKLHFLKDYMLQRNKYTKEVLLHGITEVGAWSLASGFFVGIYWMAGNFI